MTNISTDLYPQSARPTLGVSQCLLGDRVRYDGESSTSLIVVETLAALFKLVPVCPEVEAGLGVPRPPVELSGNIETPRMTGREDPSLDVTVKILDYSRHKLDLLSALDGYVFKSRSPSCGLNSTPVFINGDCVTESGRGVFAREFCLRFPDLPVIEEHNLGSTWQQQEFIDAVRAHHKRKRDRAGYAPGSTPGT